MRMMSSLITLVALLSLVQNAVGKCDKPTWKDGYSCTVDTTCQCSDVSTFLDDWGYACSDWNGNCENMVETWGYTAAEEKEIHGNCPQSCELCTCASPWEGCFKQETCDKPEWKKGFKEPATCQCEDDATYVDAYGYECSDWDGNCENLVADFGYTQKEQDTITAQCPKSCKLCPTAPAACRCGDNATYADEYGYQCSAWDGNCESMVADFGYTAEEQDEITTQCPKSCKLCACEHALYKETAHFRSLRSASDKDFLLWESGWFSASLLNDLFKLFASELLGYKVGITQNQTLFDVQMEAWPDAHYIQNPSADLTAFPVGYNGKQGVYFAGTGAMDSSYEFYQTHKTAAAQAIFPTAGTFDKATYASKDALASTVSTDFMFVSPHCEAAAGGALPCMELLSTYLRWESCDLTAPAEGNCNLERLVTTTGFPYTVIYAGNAGTVTGVKKRVAEMKGVVFTAYEPHPFLVEIKAKEIAFPYGASACANAQTGYGSAIECDQAQQPIRNIVRSVVRKLAPELYFAFKGPFRITKPALYNMMGRHWQGGGPGTSNNEVTCSWMLDNIDVVRSWLPKCAAGTKPYIKADDSLACCNGTLKQLYPNKPFDCIPFCNTETQARFAAEGTCIQRCPKGSVLDRTSKKCENCRPGTSWVELKDPFYTGFVSECKECSAGRFQPSSKQSQCDFCAPGSFAAGSAMTACTSCPAGRAAAHRGTSECSVCQEGSAMPDKNAKACQRCRISYFANTTGMQKCSKCDPGLITAGIGAVVEQTECVCPQKMVLAQVTPQMVCKPCLDGMACDSTVGTVDWALASASEFAGQQMEHPRLLPGFMILNDPYKVYRCLSTLACPGGNVRMLTTSTRRLAVGFLPSVCGPHMEKIACSSCSEGYYKDGGLCQKCETSSLLPIIFVIVGGVGGLVALVFAVNKDVLTKTPSSGCIVARASIMVSAVQTLGVFSQLHVAWIDPIDMILNAISVISFRPEVLRPGCFIGSSATRSFVAQQFLGPIGGIVMALAVALKKWMKPQSKMLIEIFNAIGSASNVFFISFLTTAVSPFVCYNHPGDAGSSMLTAPSILCWGTDDHWTMVAAGIAGVFVVPLPFLVFVIYGIVKYPSWVSGKGSEVQLRAFRFLFFRFTAQRYYYSLIVVFRTTLICITPICINDAPAIQLCAMVAIIAVFMLAQQSMRPWGDKVSNVVDGIVNILLILLLTLCLANMIGTTAPVAARDIQILSVVVLFLAVPLFGIGLCYALLQYLVPKSKFHAFICHHKGAAAAQARYLQLLLTSKAKRRVFIDSDHLTELDKLFEVVASQLDHLIVYLTRETLSRPWCAGEVVTAFRSKGKVRISRVTCTSFVAPSEAEVLDDSKSYLDLTSCNLCEYGIHVEEVNEAFKFLLDKEKVQAFEINTDLRGSHRFDWLVKELLASRSCTGAQSGWASSTSAQSRRTWLQAAAPQELGMIVISCEPGNDEATAGAAILVHKIQQDIMRLADTTIYCIGEFAVDADAVGKAVVSARAALVFLSSGSLSSELQIRVILEAMSAAEYKEASLGSATRKRGFGNIRASTDHNSGESQETEGGDSGGKRKANGNGAGRLAVVPVIMPGFTFPGAEFYGQRLHTVWEDRPLDAEALIQSFFKRIGISLATWASDTVLDAQAQDILSRVPTNFDTEAVAAMKPFFSGSQKDHQFREPLNSAGPASTATSAPSTAAAAAKSSADVSVIEAMAEEIRSLNAKVLQLEAALETKQETQPVQAAAGAAASGHVVPQRQLIDL